MNKTDSDQVMNKKGRHFFQKIGVTPLVVFGSKREVGWRDHYSPAYRFSAKSGSLLSYWCVVVSK